MSDYEKKVNQQVEIIKKALSKIQINNISELESFPNTVVIKCQTIMKLPLGVQYTLYFRHILLYVFYLKIKLLKRFFVQTIQTEIAWQTKIHNLEFAARYGKFIQSEQQQKQIIKILQGNNIPAHIAPLLVWSHCIDLKNDCLTSKDFDILSFSFLMILWASYIILQFNQLIQMFSGTYLIIIVGANFSIHWDMLQLYVSMFYHCPSYFKSSKNLLHE